ncbi:MAG: hypothetical protein ABS76_26595 [Pelagibacterium sp. SCN 64-44]|mgnify:CR=1 FL=1|nr:MAG: hypothetical protein ABS76_26595 [Pelagibacterium sp. SCN 64-44]
MTGEEEAIEKLTAAIHEAAETLNPELLEEVIDVAMVDYRPMSDLDHVLDVARAIVSETRAEMTLVATVRKSIDSRHPRDRELREAVDAFEAAQGERRRLERRSDN